MVLPSEAADVPLEAFVQPAAGSGTDEHFFAEL